MTFDDIRTKFPHLEFALFAMDAGKPVTLEVYGAGGETWSWRGLTVQEAIDTAFPPLGMSSAADPKGVVAAEPETVSAATQGGLADDIPKGGVFD